MGDEAINRKADGFIGRLSWAKSGVWAMARDKFRHIVRSKGYEREQIITIHRLYT